MATEAPDEEDTVPADVDTHTIDGHTVVMHNGIIFVDNAQATLGRPDVDVADILRQFFDHIREESAVTPGDTHIHGTQVFDAEPGTTIVINVGR